MRGMASSEVRGNIHTRCARTREGWGGEDGLLTHSLFLHLNPFSKKWVGENNFFLQNFNHPTLLLHIQTTMTSLLIDDVTTHRWRHYSSMTSLLIDDVTTHWWRHYSLMTSLGSSSHFIPTHMENPLVKVGKWSGKITRKWGNFIPKNNWTPCITFFLFQTGCGEWV